MEDFAAPLDPLFQDVPILDTTGHHVGENYPHWWRPGAFERKKGEILNQLKLGRQIEKFRPGWPGYPMVGYGPEVRAESKWKTRRALL